MSITVDEKGRITIPRELRHKLGMEPGSKVVLSLAERTLLVRKVLDAAEFEAVAEKLSQSMKEQTDRPIELSKLF